MGFAVSCECGRRVGVSAGQAGTTATCGCGRVVPVPTLSALRAAAPEGDRPAGREVDRSHLQVFGFGLVVVAQALAVVAIPLAFRDGEGFADQMLTTVALILVASLTQAAGVVVWAIGKGQPFWFGLLLTPLGVFAAVVLLMTPTRQVESGTTAGRDRPANSGR